MTSTSSAIATGLPAFDRRALIGSAALATIVAATAVVPALAAPIAAGPIEAAYSDWLAASRLADVACEATWAAEDLYQEPERPRWHPMQSEGGYKIVITDHAKRLGRCYLDDGDANIARLEALAASPFDPAEIGDVAADIGLDLHERRVAQARTDLASIRAHQAECRRRADACGLTSAQEHERPLRDDETARRLAIFAMTPTTFREAAFQATLLYLDWDELAVCRLLKTMRSLAGIPGIPGYHDEVA